ncbi:MAG: hypothetical protein IPJ85_06720 [Flavobacteriales bacterium]|nr:hypothetical protein [Flavobacteriales bacterium]
MTGPLARTTLTVRDLFADSLIESDAQGNLTLVYRGTLFTVGLDTLLEAPDTSFRYDYAIPCQGALNFTPGVSIINQADVQRFDLNDVRLRELHLREGILRMDMVNMVGSVINGRMELPSAQFPDGPPVLMASVPAGSPALPSMASALRNLAGARFDLRGPQANSVNTIQTLVSASLAEDGAGAWVTDQDSLLLAVRYTGLVPEYARGFFGQRTESFGPDTNRLGLFDNLVSGTLDLDEATLKLRIDNGFGADLRLRMRALTALNSRTGEAIDLQHALMNGPLNVTRATDTGGGFSPSTLTRVIGMGNSNIDHFIESLPDRVAYALDLELNPLGDISNGNDFVYHSSKLTANVDLEVPLRLAANELTLQTITMVDLPGNPSGHALRSGVLRVFAENGFPMQARIELATVDATGAVLTVVPVQGLVASASANAQGLVVQRTNSTLTATVDAGTLQELYDGARLRIRAAMTTIPAVQHVRILDHYAMDLQVTLEAEYMVNGDQ